LGQEESAYFAKGMSKGENNKLRREDGFKKVGNNPFGGGKERWGGPGEFLRKSRGKAEGRQMGKLEPGDEERKSKERETPEL